MLSKSLWILNSNVILNIKIILETTKFSHFSILLNLLKKFLKDFIYLFFDRGKGREKERERNVNVWLLLTWPPLGTWPTTRVCALTGNWTGNHLVCGPHSIHWATPGRVRTFKKEKDSGPNWVAQLVHLVGVSSYTPKGCRFNSWLRCIQEAADQCFSLTLMFLSLSLESINISSGEDFKKKLKERTLNFRMNLVLVFFFVNLPKWLNLCWEFNNRHYFHI